jgi:hypothetical protein
MYEIPFFLKKYNKIKMIGSPREKCRILLYVITHRTRSLSSMIEVSRGCQGEM